MSKRETEIAMDHRLARARQRRSGIPGSGRMHCPSRGVGQWCAGVGRLQCICWRPHPGITRWWPVCPFSAPAELCLRYHPGDSVAPSV